MAKMTAEQRIEWLRIVWSNFQQKAGNRREMSSAEYNLACCWLDQGLPLAVVLRAIHDFSGTPRRLEALANGVNAAAAYHWSALGGFE
jgi:hypothetical protein